MSSNYSAIQLRPPIPQFLGAHCTAHHQHHVNRILKWITNEQFTVLRFTRPSVGGFVIWLVCRMIWSQMMMMMMALFRLLLCRHDNWHSIFRCWRWWWWWRSAEESGAFSQCRFALLSFSIQFVAVPCCTCISLFFVIIIVAVVVVGLGECRATLWCQYDAL